MSTRRPSNGGPVNASNDLRAVFVNQRSGKTSQKPEIEQNCVCSCVYEALDLTGRVFGPRIGPRTNAWSNATMRDFCPCPLRIRLRRIALPQSLKLLSCFVPDANSA